MRSPDFWDYFDRLARPNLGLRANAFSCAFTYLDRLDRPVGIVETGCVREKDAWEGDGQSTVLFDKYAQTHPGSVVLSVDSDPAATALCRSLVTSRTRIHTGDSIAFLQSLTEHPPPELVHIDLLYLDSLDIDMNFEDPLPSATHHLKELLTVMPLVRPETLVVVDDSPLEMIGVIAEDGSTNLIRSPRIGGKGKLIAEYASAIGVEPFFREYQCGWLGLGRFNGSSAQVAWPPASGCGNSAKGAAPNVISEDLMVRGGFQVAEIRAVMTWIRYRPRFAKALRRTSEIARRWPAFWKGQR